jgi:hypothetical protein
MCMEFSTRVDRWKTCLLECIPLSTRSKNVSLRKISQDLSQYSTSARELAERFDQGRVAEFTRDGKGALVYRAEKSP